MALTWNMTFPSGVFSSTDMLFLKSKVKNVHVRETTNRLLVGQEVKPETLAHLGTRGRQKEKPDPKMKGLRSNDNARIRFS